MTPNEWRAATEEKRAQRRITIVGVILASIAWGWLLVAIWNGGKQ